MSITKRYKVTFECTHVLTSEDLIQIDKRVRQAAQVVTGKLTVKDSPFSSYGFAKGLILAALNGGQEAAAAFLVKYSIRKSVREELSGLRDIKVAPAYVREIR